MQAAGADRIIRIVLDGLTGPVLVNANGDMVNNNGTMPPWRDTYNDEEIAAVLSYVRSQWGNKGAEVMSEQVAKIRAATASHKGSSWTADQLLEIPLTIEVASTNKPAATGTNATAAAAPANK